MRATKSRNKATYNYKVTIDISKIMEKIFKLLPGEIEDYEYDDGQINLFGTDSCMARCSYYPQTYDSPEEFDYELLDSVDDINLNEAVREAFAINADISAYAEVDDNSIDFDMEDYDEPDPDMMPGGWDTRFD